jgi:hypothetical protein
MAVSVAPAQSYLHAATAVLDEPGGLGRAARRSAAFLIRGGLESALGDWLDGKSKGARAANFSVQLQCLQRLHPDQQLAARVAWTWAALSQATHHNGYELAPQRRDLERWMETVSAFCAGDSNV